jgi:hypothetical protein
MLAERINLRFAPDIIFREDRSSEYSVRIEEILNEIHSLENKACGQKVRKEKRLEPKKGRSRHKKK